MDLDRSSPERDRAQSHVIGVVLITGVVVLSVSMVGVMALGNIDRQVQSAERLVDVEIELGVDTLNVTNAGGATLPDDDVVVRLFDGSDVTVFDLATDPIARSGDADGIFDPGERVTFDHSTTGSVRIQVIDEDRNGLLLDVRRTVPTDPNGEPANFSVRIDNSNEPVTAGETLEVRATVTNAGDQVDTQSIDLDISGVGVDSRSLTLGGGQSEQVTLRWQTSVGDDGDYTATVSSDDDSASTPVTVLTLANFTIQIDDYDETVTEGENVTFNGTISNTGETPAVQRISLNVSGQSNPVDYEFVGILAGNSTNFNFVWQTEEGDGGQGQQGTDYTVTVASADESKSRTVTVEGTPGPPDDPGPPDNPGKGK